MKMKSATFMYYLVAALGAVMTLIVSMERPIPGTPVHPLPYASVYPSFRVSTVPHKVSLHILGTLYSPFLIKSGSPLWEPNVGLDPQTLGS